nr:reverse transcriptase domain-containing protein [Tanacetum cinerariifolium]
MADRTMEELLQAPTEGYGEAIVIPEILAENFKIKTNLLQLVQANKSYGRENDNPHTHIRNFKRMTATLKYRDVPNDAIKLMLLPYSLEDIARIWGNNFQNNQGYRAQMNNVHIPPSVPNEFLSYIKLNEIAIKSMQNQINVLRGDFSKQEENLRRNLNDDMRNILSSFFQNQPSTLGTLPSNTIPNPKGEIKDVTTRSVAYKGPSIPNESPLEKVDEQNTKEILDKEHSNSSGSTAQVQSPAVPISILEPDVPRTQTKPLIPYPSRLNDQKLQEKATNQMEKFFQIFHDLHFDISFADALLLMPKFVSTIKSLLANKDKLFELAKVPLNKNCSAMLLKKLPEKLGDPGKFLIPCDFPGMEVFHALADLGASINLMPLSIWKKHSLPELTPTRMTLELADRSITRPKGVAEDVFVKVEKFHFPIDFVVVDFEADPRVTLILGRVDVIDVACEEFVQDVLDFQYNPKSSSPTLVFDDLISESDSSKVPIVKSSSPTLTLFGEIDFFLEEIEDFLNDDLIPTGIENSVYDPEGDILFLEKLLNEDPFQIPSMDLKLAEESKEKPSVEEPPELELKELPSHLEYAFLEDSNKLPKLSNIKGIDPRFCAHKILMEDDYKPAVQSQRRVNPKIHDVIKKEVIKLLDTGMIYPISDSPWVSLIHYVPKKRGMTVVANENNELIPTRLVTGWRVCIDYWKLNDAIRKDHFPLPFMDQMLERLTGNELYCFLDGFSGKLLKFSKLAMKDLPEAIIVSISQQRRIVVKFLKSLFSQFGTPRAIISDSRTYFCNDQFTKVMIKYVVTHRLATAYHPQTSGQFEVSNRGLKRILERTVGENRTSWSDKLNDALWAFRTAYKTPIGCTPYKLVYGKSCHLPIELEHRAYWALKYVNFDLKTAGDHRKLQLNELSLALQFLSQDFFGKLKSRWSGPFTITRVFPYGTIELSQPNGPNFKVNGHRVKHYFDGDIPSNVTPDLHTFPKDN